MEILTGEVVGIRYTNPDNGWTVASMSEFSDTDFTDTAIVGIMPGLTEGITIEATGDWVESDKYGKQFKVTSYRSQTPSDGYGLQMYLESAISGLGPALAAKIVEVFSGNTAAIADAKMLVKIPGIGKISAKRISESWIEHETERGALQEIYGFLGDNDISPTYANKLFLAYGFGTVKILTQDPYKLMELDRIGFKKADAVAVSLGIEPHDPRRIRAGIQFMVDQSTQYGNCYIERDNLTQATQQLIRGVDLVTVENELDNLLADDRRLIEEGDAIYPRRLYEAEVDLARALLALQEHEAKLHLRTFELLSLREIKDRLTTDITYTEEQTQAIVQGLINRITVITGGPGTGKSTIIKGLVQAAESAFCSVALIAPTGLAAKRMKELSIHDAKTVHRTLEIDPISGKFLHGKDYPLEADLFIVDESSMIDVKLARDLVEAIPEGANIVFVGDIDQLPSVGPGNFLRDLIDSKLFPTTFLTQIFRQDAESLIIPGAHAINKGKMPQFSAGKVGDFFLFPAQDTDTAADWVVDLVTKRIPVTFGIPASEIRVLSPQKKTSAGVYALNRRLQETLNPASPRKAELIHGDRTFRVGDRILRVAKNDYDRMIVNGDQGAIVEIDKDDKGKPRIWAKLDDRAPDEEDTFDFVGDEIGTLRHGWALTIHKSQGLEFRAAVVVVLQAHYRMLVRNLVYTGVTRAKEKVVIVGNKRALGIAIGNNQVSKRTTRLTERLQLGGNNAIRGI